MALVELDRQTTCYKSPHGSLVILTVDLALFCDNQIREQGDLSQGHLVESSF